VINNGRALQLEVSKIAQYAALSNYGIRTPRTIAAVGRQPIIDAAQKMTGPFITKHNRAGKGLGVRLFNNVDALRDYVHGDAFEASVDGITLIQDYIRAPEPYITRVEFVGGKFLYAVRVDTSLGFELCPADVCQVGESFCPAGEAPGSAATPAPRFQIVDGFDDPIIERYSRFIADNGIGIAGIEFITDADEQLYTYDVNTNTNYNSGAEAVAGLFGMQAIAAYLGEELRVLDDAGQSITRTAKAA
jgi:glutathione synthase/RimK-type ligase-like ATP-grasp enzyme